MTKSNSAGLIDALVFYSLLVIIALVSIPYGTVQPWWIAIFECAVFVLAILSLFEVLLSGSWLTRAHGQLTPLLLLIAFCFAQTIAWGSAGVEVAGVQVRQTISADPYQTKLLGLKLLALLCFWGMLLRYTSTSRRLRALVYTLIAVGVASALFGLVRQTMQPKDATSFVLPHLKAGYGQFINRNHFAFLMEMVLGLVAGIILGRGGVRREQVLIYLAVALPVWTALVLSNSRGGLFAMLAQVLFVGILFTFLQPAATNVKKRGANASSLVGRIARSFLFRAGLVAGLIALVFIGALWIGGEQLATRLETVQQEVGGMETSEGVRREEIWQATWQLIKDHPIAGVGMGGYWTAIPKYHRASGKMTPQEAHNDYLELLASGGLIGVALFCWFLMLFIRSARSRLRRTGGFARAASMGSLVGIFGVAVHSFVDFGLHITINALVLVALLVIAAGEADDDRAVVLALKKGSA